MTKGDRLFALERYLRRAVTEFSIDENDPRLISTSGDTYLVTGAEDKKFKDRSYMVIKGTCYGDTNKTVFKLIKRQEKDNVSTERSHE